MDAEIIGDKEAAELFGMSVETLKHHCMAAHVCRPGTVDVRSACPVIVGRKRRWIRARIIDILSCPVV